MSLTLSYCCWLSLTFSSGPMDLLNVSHCNPLLLTVSQLHGTGREIESQLAIIGDSERHAATP